MTGSDMGQLMCCFLQIVFGAIGALASILAGLAYAFAAASWVLPLLITLAVGAFVLAIACHVVVRVAEYRYYEERERQQQVDTHHSDSERRPAPSEYFGAWGLNRGGTYLGAPWESVTWECRSLEECQQVLAAQRNRMEPEGYSFNFADAIAPDGTFHKLIENPKRW